MAHGANFNYSIWFVQLNGLLDYSIVESTYKTYINYKESEVLRLCLKHFRQRNMLNLFNTLSSSLKIQFEDSLLSDLYTFLVVDGDFKKSEDLLVQAGKQGLFNESITETAYKPSWKRILPNGSCIF